jgi:hypothetical protein
MAEKTYKTALRDWIAHPHKLGHLLGFKKLTPYHDRWVTEFIRAGAGETRALLAHRGAYKTTCGLVALTLLVMIRRNIRISVTRKSQAMASKILIAMDKIFRSEIVRAWVFAAYGTMKLETDHWSTSALRISINNRINPEPTLSAKGIGTSQTGDHYDYIWSDDIVTPEDRYSKAIREQTKAYVYETENMVEPDGVRIFTGTVWHPEDAWTVIMPMVTKEPIIQPIGTVPIPEITPEWIERKKQSMPLSLWAANYELKHVKDVDKEFGEPIPGEPPPGLTKYWYIDPAFGGEDSTAIWEGCTDGELVYLTWAKMYRRSIAEKYDEIEQLFWARDVAKVYFENVGAQKLVGVELERRRIPCEGVPANTNKFARITAALKPVWQRLRFHPDVLKQNMAPTEPGEDAPPNPLIELLEYNIDAQHDDSPDACAGLVSQLQARGEIDWEDILEIQRQIS